MTSKTRAERATEGIEILKKLRNLGVSQYDLGFIDTKALITKWIQEGETIQEVVSFPRHGRRLELLLPKRAIHAAKAAFKVVNEETRKMLEEEVAEAANGSPDSTE